jgi:hypothetical protein
MSTYPYPQCSYRTTPNLDLYPFVPKKKLKSVDVELYAKVGYWASINHFQDYKIYAIVIKMFILEFLSTLLEPPKDNPWPQDLTKKNFRI